MLIGQLTKMAAARSSSTMEARLGGRTPVRIYMLDNSFKTMLLNGSEDADVSAVVISSFVGDIYLTMVDLHLALLLIRLYAEIWRKS